MTAAVAHLMELRAKMRYDPSLYVRLHRTLYSDFGRIAGPTEALAVIATSALAWWSRKPRSAAFPWTAVAASSIASAHGVYWTVVHPANREMARWRLDAIPRNWASWRNRWEYGHAARAGLASLALGALTWSLLAGARNDETSRQTAMRAGR